MNAEYHQPADLNRWFDQLGLGDLPSVGGKNASLGEMIRELSPKGVRVPNGFATTADAYWLFLTESGLDGKIREILSGVDVGDVGNLQHHAMMIRHMILDAPLPHSLTDSIVDAYHHLCDAGDHGLADVAVRSSATAENFPEAGLAGQQETYLNVRGQASLLDACRRCYASLFTDRAISYRARHGFDDMQVALSIGVQSMVRSDLATAGVMFSIDPESGFRDAVLINAAYGLGENVVQGNVSPDEYYVFKPTLRSGCRPIIRKSVGAKSMKMVYDSGGNKLTRNEPVPPAQASRYALSDDEILQLARWACEIEDHYSQRSDRACPMDMEWAKDGRSGELFIVQARPETVQSQKTGDTLQRYRLKDRGRVMLTGRSVGEKIASGPVRVIRDVGELERFQDGEVLVADRTDPDWEPVMKRAAGVVTNRGGRTCHAAAVSREIGLPAVVATGDATEKLSDGQLVTICCVEGAKGLVYEGERGFEIDEFNVGELRRPQTKIMMNVASPDEAFALSMIPNDGVGLAREEFIISNHVKVHPQALLDHEFLDDATRESIDQITSGFDDKSMFFVDKLAEGVGTIAAAFYPKDVILRFSDFKTNEYANLIGGARYEPSEVNPMIGFRGASRYYDPAFREAFGLECRAVQKVRGEMGLTNLKLMIPFCRTVEEGRRVQDIMAEYGLVRGRDGLEIYVTCEIPSNVILADQFAGIFDGFSIGSNDLTQLTLGVDRDSDIVAHVFDERNEAVKRMIRSAIGTAKSCGVKIGLCGPAPSDYPEFAEFLVCEGIDSISLTPDAVLKTTMHVLEVEEHQFDRSFLHESDAAPEATV